LLLPNNNDRWLQNAPPQRKPLALRLELSGNCGYVIYAEENVAKTVLLCEDGSVAADLDENGRILGIELLDNDDETLATARAFAEARGLAFPKRLDGSGLAP